MNDFLHLSNLFLVSGLTEILSYITMLLQYDCSIVQIKYINFKDFDTISFMVIISDGVEQKCGEKALR